MDIWIIFHFLATVNNTVMIIYTHVYVWTVCIWFILGIYLGVELLNHMVNLCWTSRKT